MKYKTKQRDLILNYLIQNQDKHVTADNIIEYLKENNTPVGKSTVYRYLDALIEQNAIRKYHMEDGTSACYQLASQNPSCIEHYHFKCNKCGDLLHVSCDTIKSISSHIYEEHDFVLDSSKTVFYGRCGKCGE